MTSKHYVLKSLTVAALFAVSGASHAALTAFNTSASFLSGLTAVGTDGFTNFSNTATTVSPVSRSTIGSVYSYTATTSASTFYGGGTSANPFLSTNLADSTITFSAFSPSVKAIGANFFGSDINGAFLAGDVIITAIDSLGASLAQTITGATMASFLGFKSTGTIVSLSIASVQAAAPLWPSVDNLTLGQIAAVPEPETYALMLAGLGIVGFMARRRSR